MSACARKLKVINFDKFHFSLIYNHEIGTVTAVVQLVLDQLFLIGSKYIIIYICLLPDANTRVGKHNVVSMCTGRCLFTKETHTCVVTNAYSW